MKIKEIGFILTLFMMFLLTGCSDQQQIYQKLIVQGIGIDKSEVGYSITIQALDFQNPVSKDEPSIKILRTSGTSLVSALENITKETSLTPIYSQNLLVIISESIAKIGTDQFIDFFIRHCETRPKVKICITKKTAFEIFNIKINNKSIKSQSIHDLIPDELNSDILHFVRDLKSKISDPYVAWVEPFGESEKSSVKLMGIGVFSENKLNLFLKDDEALGFMILKGVPKFGAYNLDIPEFDKITGTIDKSNVSTKIDLKNKKIYLNLNVDIRTFSSGEKKQLEAYFDENSKKVIEKKFSQMVKESCYSAIKKCVAIKSDTFNVGRLLKKSDTNFFKSIENNWKNEFCNFEFVVSAKVKASIIGKEAL